MNSLFLIKLSVHESADMCTQGAARIPWPFNLAVTYEFSPRLTPQYKYHVAERGRSKANTATPESCGFNEPNFPRHINLLAPLEFSIHHSNGIHYALNSELLIHILADKKK